MALRTVALCVVLASWGVAALLEEKGAKNRPVSKVVTLLKDMTNELAKEAEEDEEVFEALGCW
jgi:hypothetical protein